MAKTAVTPANVRYRAFVLGGLLAAYSLSTADRVVIGIVQESLKHEFALSDFQLGLLGGPAFAVLYTVMGLPLARWSDHGNRVSILSACLLAWSAMTALCGLATSFVMLLVARIGVSIGEAGCNPASNSLISDYFPPERRATALSVYVLGVPFGGLLAALGGGWLTAQFGWRAAFIGLGLPGVALGIVVKLAFAEPARSRVADEEKRFSTVLRVLAGKSTFWNSAFASALAGFVGYGLNQYLTSFLIRTHGLSLLQGASAVGLVIGLCGAVGAFGTGFLSDRLSHSFPRALAQIPALGLSIATPCYLLAFVLPKFVLALPVLMLGAACHALYMGAMYALAQGVVPSRMRASAVAITLVVVTLIGYGLGPPLLGYLSDALGLAALIDQGLSPDLCRDGPASAACKLAASTGLRDAMMIVCCVQLWAAFHFWLASRTMHRDWVD